ncbi:hypothetical protein [Methylobacterium sp. Leaf85]|uniref:hypothetical protein n=1 Tax=Methylobacterium sp. Leaf85 TaxID=1736241 RepID=UPI0006FEE296|nr:hypothetical protein [Methylobacterium sp. Leaf85]KQO43040.1 hypothetical protein ASF08_10715 [Methylobacterium sp. Leaf85]
MTAAAIASLLKDYGLVGALALALAALGLLVHWLKESWIARLDDKQAMVERVATAIERQSSTNVDLTEAIKDLRDAQASILKTATEAALTSSANDRAILKEIDESRKAIERNVGARP